MPTYKEENQRYYMERIKEVLALKRNAGALTIRKALEGDPNSPLILDRIYIAKLLQKIRGERIHRFDQARVEERLAEIQDRTESVVEQMWRMLLDASAPEVARVAAAKAIVDSDHKLFDAQLNAGIYERKLGTVEVRHGIAPENKILIINALLNYGIINPRTGGEIDREPRSAAGDGTPAPRLQNPLPSALPHS